MVAEYKRELSQVRALDNEFRQSGKMNTDQQARHQRYIHAPHSC